MNLKRILPSPCFYLSMGVGRIDGRCSYCKKWIERIEHVTEFVREKEILERKGKLLSRNELQQVEDEIENRTHDVQVCSKLVDKLRNSCLAGSTKYPISDNSSINYSKLNHKRTCNSVQKKKKKKKSTTQLRELRINNVIANESFWLQISDIPGKKRGVKTKRKFRKGEMVLEFAGQLITVSEAENRETKDYPKYGGPSKFYFPWDNGQWAIDGAKANKRMGMFLNHSFTPNLILQVMKLKGGNTPRLIFLAKCNIEKNVELTISYGKQDPDVIDDNPWLLSITLKPKAWSRCYVSVKVCRH